MKALTRLLAATALVAVPLVGLVGCEREGPLESTGRQADEAVEDVGEGLEDLGDELEDLD